MAVYFAIRRGRSDKVLKASTGAGDIALEIEGKRLAQKSWDALSDDEQLREIHRRGMFAPQMTKDDLRRICLLEWEEFYIWRLQGRYNELMILPRMEAAEREREQAALEEVERQRQAAIRQEEAIDSRAERRSPAAEAGANKTPEERQAEIDAAVKAFQKAREAAGTGATPEP